ncbi:MAG TPA: tRNA (adenosine(37)-N6)-dimethylallyltransferase MiaA [Polyangiaceae bacterium]|nr:tRNA (adenosine(37)-N6)-dimethylallyltransferase MiaA [Polyangiaceae bacterium]
MNESSPLLVIVGPTASGKTELAVRLAEQCGGEIVSADSVQVYRRFDIGTGKPSAEQRARAPHHLIDCLDPLEPMDAARWAERAEHALAEISARGKIPIVCGGSFLWIKALLYGLVPAPPANEALRQRHREIAEAEGRGALHAELSRLDPESAQRLAPNDLVRVSRALEVLELSGVPLSHWHARHGFRQARHRARLIGIAPPPTELDRRIAERVEAMLAAGWVEEVRSLLASGYSAARAMSSVGYRQITLALQREPGLVAAQDRDEIRRKTRVFARRQRTWLRDATVHWLPAPDLNHSQLADIIAS